MRIRKIFLVIWAKLTHHGSSDRLINLHSLFTSLNLFTFCSTIGKQLTSVATDQDSEVFCVVTQLIQTVTA